MSDRGDPRTRDEGWGRHFANLTRAAGSFGLIRQSLERQLDDAPEAP